MQSKASWLSYPELRLLGGVSADISVCADSSGERNEREGSLRRVW